MLKGCKYYTSKLVLYKYIIIILLLFCTYVCFLVFMRLCFYMNCQKVILLILINNTSFLKRLYNLFSFWIGDITYISDILYTCMYITFLNRWLSPFNSVEITYSIQISESDKEKHIHITFWKETLNQVLMCSMYC